MSAPGIGDQPAGAQGLGAVEGSSPELAIKIAYDFGRSLRMGGAEEADLPRLLSAHVDEPLSGSTLVTYIRAGFIAGFHFAPLPWRREIERAAKH